MACKYSDSLVYNQGRRVCFFNKMTLKGVFIYVKEHRLTQNKRAPKYKQPMRATASSLSTVSTKWKAGVFDIAGAQNLSYIEL